jgi:hypothetical protein
MDVKNGKNAVDLFPVCQKGLSTDILGVVITAFCLELYIFDISQVHLLGLLITIFGYAFSLLLNSKITPTIEIRTLFYKNLQKSIGESLFLSGVFIIISSWISLIYNNSHSFFRLDLLDSSYLSYFWIAPLQELTLRGIWQSKLCKILPPKYAKYGSILIPCTLFFMGHLIHSMTLSIVSFWFGFLCGLMFHCHQNIIGVSIFHTLVGNYIGLIGIWDIIIH